MSDRDEPKVTINAVQEALQHVVQSRPGGQTRPQQKNMVEAVTRAFTEPHHLVVQAGTGVGKTFGYLVPSILSGQRVIVSTATRQLSDQIAADDLPVLKELLPEQTFTHTLLKGRDNYVCRMKLAELARLEEEATASETTTPLFDDIILPKSKHAAHVASLNEVLDWVDTTDNGDRVAAPACNDDVWKQVSVNAAGCVGAAACEFSDMCFSEKARKAARTADIVVTNHALVAADMISKAPLFADADAIIFDEAHEMEDYLTRAWGKDLDTSTIRAATVDARRALPTTETGKRGRDSIERIVETCTAIDEILETQGQGILPELGTPLSVALTELGNHLTILAAQLVRNSQQSDIPVAAQAMMSVAKTIDDLNTTVHIVTSPTVDIVRWIQAPQFRRSAMLRTAPLNVGPELIERLETRTMIATSATLSVGGSFDRVTRMLGLDDTINHHTLDVGTPFNYQQQSMLCIPTKNTFPEPVGAHRTDHIAAVKNTLTELVHAANGRTLALFTTRAAANETAQHLRDTVPTPILAQGDAPPAVLINEFAINENATLCATMGFWHGLNVTGSTCSCVVMDKIPFAPFNDPLLEARLNAAKEDGRNGFSDIYVADAAIKIAQGFGRLIRTSQDRGVVAILDPRLHSKPYGKTILQSLPTVNVYTDLDVAAAALTRLTSPLDEQEVA